MKHLLGPAALCGSLLLTSLIGSGRMASPSGSRCKRLVRIPPGVENGTACPPYPRGESGVSPCCNITISPGGEAADATFHSVNQRRHLIRGPRSVIQ